MDEIIREIQNREQNYKEESFQDFEGFIEKLDGYIADFNDRIKSENKLLSVNELFKEERKGKQFFQHDEFCRMTGFNQNGQLKPGIVNDYKGVYIFCKKFLGEIYPVYIGISQRISQRLRGHLIRNDKNTTTWFYMMAKKENGNKPFVSNKDASQAIEAIRDKWIGGLKVMAYPVEGNYELALAEIYMASKLKVYWNSFETH